MKKRFILFLVIIMFALSGCNKTVSVATIVKEDDNLIAAINYPNTNIKLLDKNIKDYVDIVYKNIKKEALKSEDRIELNIDYIYNNVDNKYYSVVIKVFIDNPNAAHPTYYNKTFLYDSNKNDIININDIVKDFKGMVDLVKTEIKNKYGYCVTDKEIASMPNKDKFYNLFSLDNKNIIFYFNPYTVGSGACGLLEISIPLNKLGITVKENKLQNTKVIAVNNRVIDTSKKIVALTFDDGPSYYTSKIIEYLKEEDVVATFFVLGNKINVYSDTLKKLAEYGNEIGNHTYSHKLLTRLKEDELKEQINKTNSLLEEKIGYKPKVFRPTYGTVNSKIRNSTDLSIVLWDVDTLDWKIKNNKKIATRALKKIDDKDIVLMHDTYERILKAIKIMIPKLKEEGFIFVTVSELNKLKLLSRKNE